MTRFVVALFLGLQSWGCAPPELTLCGERACASGTRCLIEEGICVPLTCGNGALDPGELCDGSPQEPHCTDHGFELGTVGCTGACQLDMSGCARFGWVSETTLRTDMHLGHVWFDAGAGQLYAAGVLGGDPQDPLGFLSEEGAVFQFDGESWQIPYRTGEPAALFDVWGTGTEVFAVGERGRLVRHELNGSAGWRSIELPGMDRLLGVWGSVSEELFLVGTPVDRLRPVLLRYDGSTTRVEFEHEEPLFGVWGTANNDVFVVGDAHKAQHFDGESWSTLQIPDAGEVGSLLGVWGLGDSVFFVGGKGSILRYRRTTKTVTAERVEPDDERTTYYDVWGTDEAHLYAVGTGGTIVQYDKGAAVWRRAATGVTRALLGVVGDGEGRVWAVGTHGTVLTLSGYSIDRMEISNEAGCTPNVEVVWGTGDQVYGGGLHGAVWSFGESLEAIESWRCIVPDNNRGTVKGFWETSSGDLLVLHRYGLQMRSQGVWSDVPLPVLDGVELDLRAISGLRDRDDVFIVGASGVVLRLVDGAWVVQNCEIDDPLTGGDRLLFTGVAVRGEEAFITSRSGLIVRYRASACEIVFSDLAPPQLEAIVVTSEGDLFAGGATGRLYRCDRGSECGVKEDWIEARIGANYYLDISARASTDVFAVGHDGALARFDGTRWSPIVSESIQNDIKGVWMAPDGDVFLGDEEGLLRMKRPSL